jgi:hypothetical protein
LEAGKTITAAFIASGLLGGGAILGGGAGRFKLLPVFEQQPNKCYTPIPGEGCLCREGRTAHHHGRGVTGMIAVATIGFTQTSAEGFFERLLRAGVRKVVDVRLHNTSQLAGFAKAEDLAYFLKQIGGIDYAHEPLLAPTEEIFKAFKKEKDDWGVFQRRFLDLMVQRQIETRLRPEFLDGNCLLCSEATPHHCHRRLVCEYLNERWGGGLSVNHL